jgi:isocitrate/isopropylmalate dehydrogenase
MAAFRQGDVLTRDLGGTATTRQFTDAVKRHLEA